MKQLSYYLKVLSIATMAIYAQPLLADITYLSGNTITPEDYLPGLELSIGGLYLQPRDDLKYHVLGINPNASNPSEIPINAGQKQPNNNYNLGYQIGLGYLIPNSNNDLNLNWTHLATSTTRTQSQESYDNFEFGGNASASTEAKSSFNYDAVNVDLGHYISLTSSLSLRPFVSLSYAKLSRDFNTNIALFDTISGEDLYDTIKINHASESTFQGIGPRIGLNTTYNLWSRVGFIANIASALLIGNTTNNESISAHWESNYQTVPPDYNNSIHDKSGTHIVPSLEAKLGFSYTYNLNQNGTVLTTSLGYQTIHYFNVFRQIYADATTQLVDNPNGPFSTITPIFNKKKSDIAFSGPYLSLNLQF